MDDRSVLQEDLLFGLNLRTVDVCMVRRIVVSDIVHAVLLTDHAVDTAHRGIAFDHVVCLLGLSDGELLIHDRDLLAGLLAKKIRCKR